MLLLGMSTGSVHDSDHTASPSLTESFWLSCTSGKQSLHLVAPQLLTTCPLQVLVAKQAAVTAAWAVMVDANQRLQQHMKQEPDFHEMPPCKRVKMF